MVKFDPGIGDLAIDFNEFIDDFYSQLMSFKSISQKRLRFKLYRNKIIQRIENNIAFYCGCLLWAKYLKEEYSDNPQNIEGNVFYNMPEEVLKNYDYLIQVDFMKNYFSSFEKDFLYYCGKKFIINEQWKKILELYTFFLKQNNGFINVKTTQDLKIPEEIKDLTIISNIPETINLAIKQKNLSTLLDYMLKC